MDLGSQKIIFIVQLLKDKIEQHALLEQQMEET